MSAFEREKKAYAAALPHLRRAREAYANAMARDSDRSPEGEKPKALSAKHESAGRNGIAQNTGKSAS